MAAPSSMTRLLHAFRRFEQTLAHWLRIPPPPGFQGALICNEHPQMNLSGSDSVSVTVSSIFDSIMRASAPKKRRSKQVRMTRKFGMLGHFEKAMPKKNIIACLECGQWHEKQTICGNCYEAVRAETKEMQKGLGRDALKYSAPRSEIVFLYEDDAKDEEERPTFKGKYIVEMKKPRPSWFSKNLMTKSNNRGESGD